MTRRTLRQRTIDSAPEPEEAPRPPSRFRRFVRWTFRSLLALFLIGAIALGVSVAVAVERIPSFDTLKGTPPGQTIRVRAVDGTVFLTLGPNYGEWLPLSKTPRVMADAMVAVEDRRFRYHPGVDPIGVLRAAKFAFDTRGTGRRMHGASTITQQLARNVFLSNSYTWSRKLREAILAMALEWKFSKDQILELYLNKVYFGGGSYGIDAASRRFFDHPATTLSLGEAAVIAGLVKAPSRYAPTADADAALDRARVVLSVMADAGVITPEQARTTKPANLRAAVVSGETSARYFTDWALPQLDMLIDEGTASLDVWTTIDLNAQRTAQNAVNANTPKGAQGALVSIDRDGAVRALVGGQDYVKSNYNRATKALRQPGSAFKLFVYMAALEAGYKVDDQVNDVPVTINGWSPRNSSGGFNGAMSLRTAFANSINTVAVQLGNEVGFSTVANMAQRFGITTEIKTHPSMVLGASEVHLIDLTAAFASVNARGHAVRPYGISKVATTDGTILYQRTPQAGAQLVDDWVAAQTIDLLQTAVNTGTGRAAQIGRPVAGKTGTTTANKDGWFVGFSSGLTTGVWMGHDSPTTITGLQGGRAPAKTFADFMRVAVANRPVEPFDTEVKLPEWQLEDTEDAYFGEPSQGDNSDPFSTPSDIPYAGDGSGVDVPAAGRPAADGEPVGTLPPDNRPTINERWIDEVTGAPQPQPRPTNPPPSPAETPREPVTEP